MFQLHLGRWWGGGDSRQRDRPETATSTACRGEAPLWGLGGFSAWGYLLTDGWMDGQLETLGQSLEASGPKQLSSLPPLMGHVLHFFVFCFYCLGNYPVSPESSGVSAPPVTSFAVWPRVT